MRTLKLIRKSHLGDGLYAGFDGYQVWLWADRDGMRHSVAVEMGVASALMGYLPDAFHREVTDEERKELTRGIHL